ncbi:MAG: hypothetical protein ACXAD7_24375 [Candidatus Kariarchaeaceae archaeon]|jgi:hypothetical protein
MQDPYETIELAEAGLELAQQISDYAGKCEMLLGSTLEILNSLREYLTEDELQVLFEIDDVLNG